MRFRCVKTGRSEPRSRANILIHHLPQSAVCQLEFAQDDVPESGTDSAIPKTHE